MIPAIAKLTLIIGLAGVGMVAVFYDGLANSQIYAMLLASFGCVVSSTALDLVYKRHRRLKRERWLQ
jgi:hypothetical protein